MITPEGDLRVLQALSEKMWLRFEGDDKHKQIRPLLLILGGMMRGVVGAGIANALTKNNFHNAFTNIVGISVGAPIGAYILANMTEVGASILYEECTKSFISIRRPRVVDMDYIVDVIRGKRSNGTKKLDVRRVIESHSDFYVGVTDSETGLGELIDARRARPDIFALMKASMEYPIYYSHPVKINERLYIDGSIGLPFPSQEVINRFNPTHILVIPNGSESGPNILSIEKLINSITRENLSPEVAHVYETRNERFKEGLEYLNKSEVPSLVLWTDDSIKPVIKLTTTDATKLFKAFSLAEYSMLKLCSEAHTYTSKT